MTITSRYKSTCRKCGGQINVGDQIEWSRESGARHLNCPAAAPEIPGSFKIGGGEGYGYSAFREGQILRWRDRGIVKVISARSTYYREDGMSFGVGDEAGYIHSATVIPATDEEAAPIIEAERYREQKKGIAKQVNDLKTIIRETGTKPDGDNKPDGEKVLDTQDIYGGGDWFVIGTDKIWYVQNNGRDGDNWGWNNIITGGAGAIGWYIPFDDTTAAELRTANEILTRKS